MWPGSATLGPPQEGAELDSFRMLKSWHPESTCVWGINTESWRGCLWATCSSHWLSEGKFSAPYTMAKVKETYMPLSPGSPLQNLTGQGIVLGWLRCICFVLWIAGDGLGESLRWLARFFCSWLLVQNWPWVCFWVPLSVSNIHSYALPPPQIIIITITPLLPFFLLHTHSNNSVELKGGNESDNLGSNLALHLLDMWLWKSLKISEP